jgi:hypothetical protein
MLLLWCLLLDVFFSWLEFECCVAASPLSVTLHSVAPVKVATWDGDGQGYLPQTAMHPYSCL